MLSPSAFSSAGNTYLDLDYSGYHKNFIQQLFIIIVWEVLRFDCSSDLYMCMYSKTRATDINFLLMINSSAREKVIGKWSLRDDALIFFIKYSQLVLKEISEFSVANLFVNTTMCMHDYCYYCSVNASDIHNNQTSPD